jgi:hypothetical protein
MVATIMTIIVGALSKEVTTEMQQVPAGKIIDLGIHDHSTYHPKKY